MKSDSLASPREYRQLVWWLLRQHRFRLLYLLIPALPLSVLLQAFVFGAAQRFLYGYWLVALLLFLMYAAFLLLRLASPKWPVANRKAEALWLVNFQKTATWKTSDAVVWARRQALPPPEAVPVPWLTHLCTAIFFSLVLQVPLFPVFAAWVTAGHFGPVLQVTQALIQDEIWTDIPPAYTGLPARQLAVADRKFELLEGSILQLQAKPLTSLPLFLGDDVQKISMQVYADKVSGRIKISADTRLHLGASGSGLVLADPVPVHVRILTDELPETSWLYADLRQRIDVDDVWKMRLHFQDRFGLIWVGYAIVDEAGTLVTETVAASPKTITDISFRLVPEMHLDRLKSGVWQITPIAMDNKPGRQRPGYGTAVTLTVISRYDRHKERLKTVDELFQYALGVLADLWEQKKVNPQRTAAVINHLWQEIARIEKDFWSTFGYDKLLTGQKKLLASLRQQPVDILLFEEGVRSLLRGKSLENLANIADRTDGVQRAQQDLMAALADENASDRELMQLLSELQKKMQALAESLQNKNQMLPQESYNKEAFKKENVRENQDSLQSVLDALRKGDRRSAMDMLSRMMEKVDQMQTEAGDPSPSGEEESQDQQGSGSDTQSAGLKEAQKAIRKGIASQTRSLEKDRNLGNSSSENRQVQDQADGTGKKLDQVSETLKKLDKNGSLGRERELVEKARSSWQKGLKALPQSSQGRPTSAGSGRMQFRQQGEESLRLMRQARQSLQEKESRSRQPSRKGQRGSRPKDEKLKSAKQKNSLAATRKRVLDSFSEGLPPPAEQANRDYFKQLVK